MKCERRERTRERKRRKGQKKKARKSVTGHATEEYGSLRTAGDHHYGEDISQQLRKRGGKKIIKRKSHGEPRRSRGEVEEKSRRSRGEPRRATESHGEAADKKKLRETETGNKRNKRNEDEVDTDA